MKTNTRIILASAAAGAFGLLALGGSISGKEPIDVRDKAEKGERAGPNKIGGAGKSIEGGGLGGSAEPETKSGKGGGGKGKGGSKGPGGVKGGPRGERGGPGGEGGGGEALGDPNWDPGSGQIPPGAECLSSDRPNLARLNVVIHNRPREGKIVLDSTPITCGRNYCRKHGYPNRNCCPLGPDGTSHRIGCELVLMGVDPTDGIPGPHWMFRGNGEIQRHGSNPFLAFVFFPKGGGGTASACSNRKPVVCGNVKVP